MAYVIPSDTHNVADTGHTGDHNNVADVLGLVVNALAQSVGPSSVQGTPPAGNAAAIAALQAAALWSGPFTGIGYFPWQFPVGAYGAVGNGKVVTDAAMTSGSANLACTTSTPFTSTGVDGGKSIIVETAKGSFAHLSTTILSVTDTGHAVLNASATATTAGTPGAIMYFGTDDTAHIQAALNAAVAYAQSHQNGYAEVVFQPLIYIVAGAPVLGGATLGNAQIMLPIIAETGQKITIAFRSSTLDSSVLYNWDQLVVQASSTTLACTRTDGTNDATFGPAAMIGGPVSGYGGEGPGLFSNMMFVLDGINCLVPYNSTYSGVDLFGIAEAHIKSGTTLAAAVVPAASAPVPTMSSQLNLSNLFSYGLRMPCAGNNDNCTIVWFLSEGICYGLGISEQTVALRVEAIYCLSGLAGYPGNGTNMVDAATIVYAEVEQCTNAWQQVGSGTVGINMVTLSTESTSMLVYDPSNFGQGIIGLQGDATTVYNTSGARQNGATGIRMINIQMPSGPVASPQATVASGSAWFNGYYRDAWITLLATTITALKIDAVTQNLPTGSTTIQAFMLPSGHSYTATYTGTLTHTVALL